MCSTTTGALVQFGGQNVGDLLNDKGITWGFFEGGFNLTTKNPNGTTGCARSHTSTDHQISQGRLHPASPAVPVLQINREPDAPAPHFVEHDRLAGDQANHQYDIDDFFAAVKNGNMPAVSFLKAPGYQDGHAGYSDPLDEQTWIVDGDQLPAADSRNGSSTAVVIAYDDSDGWYDHQMGPIVNQSADRRRRTDRPRPVRQQRQHCSRRRPMPSTRRDAAATARVFRCW